MICKTCGIDKPTTADKPSDEGFYRRSKKGDDREYKLRDFKQPCKICSRSKRAAEARKFRKTHPFHSTERTREAQRRYFRNHREQERIRSHKKNRTESYKIMNRARNSRMREADPEGTRDGNVIYHWRRKGLSEPIVQGYVAVAKVKRAIRNIAPKNDLQ